MLNKVLVTLAIASLSFAAPAANAACDSYVLTSGANSTAGVALASRTFIDFSKYAAGSNAQQILDQNGFHISSYTINSTPYARTFSPAQVSIGQGVLEMKVLPAQGNNVPSAEIQTYDTFLYGSVRVVYQVSSTPGVCEGSFFYKNDQQETDWEVLTSTIDTSNPGVPAGIWATNQATGSQPKVTKTVPFTFNPRTGFHEYRIDWTAGATIFYIDGVEKARHTTAVPNQASYYIFNTWSNGDKYWSNGPPTSTSVTKIRSIDLYKGYLPKAQGNACEI